MIITVDTNVIFSALFSTKGASHQILNLILNKKLQLALTSQIYFEYYNTLARKENLEKLNISLTEIEKILDLISLLAKKYSIFYFLRPNPVDEKDNMFIECAFISNSDYLITSNIKHFKSGELKGFQFTLITPGDFFKLWRKKNE